MDETYATTYMMENNLLLPNQSTNIYAKKLSNLFPEDVKPTDLAKGDRIVAVVLNAPGTDQAAGTVSLHGCL
jgi:hypothetical protein